VGCRRAAHARDRRPSRVRHRAKAGFQLPDGKSFIIVEEDQIGKAHRFSSEKLSPVLAIFKYSDVDSLVGMVSAVFEVGGKGHSLGIASFNDALIHRLAMMAPVSRMMVRQPNVSGNAGSFTNGMPMTASLGCGTWGGNITSENISVKHYMNTTWVSRPIPEDRPSRTGVARRVLQLRDVRRLGGCDRALRRWSVNRESD
jgi:hypothetical protein